MKFTYQYRTRDNVVCSGEVDAPTRDDAFVQLKAQGIKPSRVEEAPGLFNKLFGKGKRWIAISVLGVAVVALLLGVMALRNRMNSLAAALEDSNLYAERAQIYGDPAVLRDAESKEWQNVFTNEVELLLAQYAIPGKPVVRRARAIDATVLNQLSAAMQPIEVRTQDLAEIAQMKRIVNGMKRELRDYLAAGGRLDGYARRLAARQREEIDLYGRVRIELERSKDETLWQTRNAALRRMGLPMVDRDPERPPEEK